MIPRKKLNFQIQLLTTPVYQLLASAGNPQFPVFTRITTTAPLNICVQQKKNNADGVLKFQQCHLTSIGRALQCSLTKSTEEKTKKRNNYQIRLCAPKWKVFLSDCRWNEEQLLPSALHHFQGAWISCLASLLLPTTGSENMHRVFEVKAQFLCWILHCFHLLQIGRALALDFFPLLKEKNLCATTCNFLLN